MMLPMSLCLSVCLSRKLGLSREQRGLEDHIGTEVAHVTRDSDTTFKVKVTRTLYSPPCWCVRQLQRGGRGKVLAVKNCCYVAVCSAARGASAPTGEERGGAYRGGRPPTACLME